MAMEMEEAMALTLDKFHVEIIVYNEGDGKDPKYEN
jgi:hypothetical protein